MKLTLRGHHILCLKGFQGYGYDEDFVENMKKINSIRKHESTTVSLISTADDICRHCPNLNNNLCENQTQNKRITQMDEEVLKQIEFTEEYKSVELFEKVDEIFKTKKSVSKICFNCLWHEKCLFYQNLSDNR